MKWFILCCLLAGLLLGSCSGEGGRADSADLDGVAQDGDRGGAVQCDPQDDTCAGGLTCLCCGSIGPRAICLCSKACASDPECQGSGLPECNRPGPGADGICTPSGYNCCWMCQ